jgi:hypothetical protein
LIVGLRRGKVRRVDLTRPSGRDAREARVNARSDLLVDPLQE